VRFHLVVTAGFAILGQLHPLGRRAEAGNPASVATRHPVAATDVQGGALRFTLRILGLDIIDAELSTEAPSVEPEDPERDLSGGTLTSTPIGFTAQPRDQRWEPPLREEGWE
jgi:hypothetical protein